MIKLSDYVIDFLVKKGISDIFMVSGGGIIHLVDSVGRNKDIRYFCNYNEQATGYCAEGYARFKNSISACLVTTGPGSTNAVSGVASAWADSMPMIVISGQVKRELIADYTKLRQTGEQEVNIIDIVRPITKYAKTVLKPESIRYELESAFYYAVTGRPGPVWINIPLDVQGILINEKALCGFKPPAVLNKPKPDAGKQVASVIKELKKAKRPVILCGNGIRLAKAQDLLQDVLKLIRIPVILSFNGIDLLPETCPMLIGRAGITGQRRANLAIQNADCLFSIGSRLNVKIIGYNYKAFAPKAKKIVIDIDKEELKKQTVLPDIAICSDAKDFLAEFRRQAKKTKLCAPEKWLIACLDWKKRYSVISAEFFNDKKYVNTYVFYDKLSDLLLAKDTLVTGNGLSAVSFYQAFKAKKNQRAFTNNGYGAMGWDLPAAIGACIANKRMPVVCVTGDGSIQMNIQELQFIKYYKLPIKIFVLNNYGYTSIRLTQDTFFNSCYTGADEKSGVSNPDFKKVAAAYGLNYEKIRNNNELKSKISKVLRARQAVLCEVNVSPCQGISPKVSSYRKLDGTFESRPLEDMFPFLPREELKENMSISSNPLTLTLPLRGQASPSGRGDMLKESIC